MCEAAGKRADVAIAEFNALRAEILDRRGSQKNIVGLALVAYGSLFTLGLDHHGDKRLLLVIPCLGLVLALLQVADSFHIARIGNYIRKDLWKELQDLTGFRHSWESQYSKLDFGVVLGGILSDGLVPILLGGGAAAATYLYNDRQPGHLSTRELWVWYGASTLPVVVVAAFGIYIAATREKLLETEPAPS